MNFGLPLIIIGDGPEKRKLLKIAKKNIKFKKFTEKEMLIEEYRNCKAFVFMAEEDFGMVMAEATACGRPVIAYKKGGASEIVIDKKTGILFDKQNVESLKESVLKMEEIYTNFNSKMIRENARKFSEENFKTTFKEFIKRNLN